jgi:formylglycine-generating enzyme required for sulfatase activity
MLIISRFLQLMPLIRRSKLCSVAILLVVAAESAGAETADAVSQAARYVDLPDAKIELVYIRPGKFEMGSRTTEKGHQKNEEPVTTVALSNGFWLGKYLITQGQWKAVMKADINQQAEKMIADETEYTFGQNKQTLRQMIGYEGTFSRLIGVAQSDYPIYYVNWQEAQDFCDRLNAREQAAGHLPAGYKFRLPTEAEWEYACRAGTNTATYGGDLEIIGKNNAPILDKIAWYGGNSSVEYKGPGWSTANWVGRQYDDGKRAGPRAVGGKRPNEWKLFDMLGNLSVWCVDWYSSKLPGGNTTDPIGPTEGTEHVIRGGSWRGEPRQVRSAARGHAQPGFRLNTIGVRIVLGPALAAAEMSTSHPVTKQ